MRMKLRKWIHNLLPTMPKRSNRFLHIAVFCLLIFGFIMVMSTLSAKNYESKYFVKEAIKSVLFIIASYWGMCIMAKNFHLTWFKKHHWKLGVILIIAMIATLFFPGSYGAHCWIVIGPFSVQPIEFVKVFMIIILALYIEMGNRSSVKLWYIIRVPLFYLAVFVIIGLAQKDLGSVIILIAIVCGLVLFATDERFKGWKIAILVVGGLGLIGCAFAFTETGISLLSKIPFIAHIATRFQNTINPFIDPNNGGYQMIHGLYGFAHGGLKGVGLGNSIQKYGYLTQSDSDYILSIIVEETGILGLSLVVLSYFVILIVLFRYTRKAKSEGLRFILMGTAIYIFMHFFLNVGGVGGLIPLTGVPLLFISSGGSSLVSIMGCIGICQNIIALLRRSGSTKKKKKRATA